MECTKPIRLTKGLDKTLYPYGLEVPCGKCLNCHKKKRSEWSLRMLHELEVHNDACFITLTYDDDNIPENKSLSKRDLQLFIKRLRHNLQDRRIRYFACGEYGDRTHRPHYHAIIYGLSIRPDDRKLVKWSWDKCDWTPIREQSCFGLAEPESINYVAGYILKTYYGDIQQELYTKQGREIPFKLASQGIGRDYVLKYKDKIQACGYITRNGSKISIPRYYANKLELDITSIRQQAIEKDCSLVYEITGNNITRDDAYMLLSVDEVLSIEDKLKQSNAQRELNLVAKSKIKNSKL